MARHDTLLLVVARGVASKLKNLGSEVLEDSGEVDWCASTDTGCVVAVLEKTVDTTNGELETSLLRTRLGLARCITSRCLASLARFAALARLQHQFKSATLLRHLVEVQKIEHTIVESWS